MKAYELLNDKSKWCQGANARNARQRGVASTSPAAVKWGLLGAFARCYGLDRPADYIQQWARLRTAVGEATSITAWNDDPARTYAEVVGLLKRLDI